MLPKFFLLFGIGALISPRVMSATSFASGTVN